MARRGGLGKGLGALIPSEAGGEEGSVLRDLPIGQVVPNPYQPRRHFDDALLDQLSSSIKTQGLLQPVLVRPLAELGPADWRYGMRLARTMAIDFGLGVEPGQLRPRPFVAGVELERAGIVGEGQVLARIGNEDLDLAHARQDRRLLGRMQSGLLAPLSDRFRGPVLRHR